MVGDLEIPSVRNVLTVSSHVNHGYVGNDALQFPLNLRDWNIDCIHTTNFSTHPGHGMDCFSGKKTKAEDVVELYKGLKKFSIEWDSIIVGYVGSSENLSVVFNDILTHELTHGNKPFIIIDPIMGDHGKFYVDESIVEGYKSFLSSNKVGIDLLTPNQFEFETLTGIKVDSWDDLKLALEKFCSMYPQIKNLVVTSVQLGDSDDMYCIGNSKSQLFYYKVNEVNAVFSGSGDLFLGLLMDEFIRSDSNLQLSLGRTLLTVENVLALTYELSKDDPNVCKKKVGVKMYLPDLKIIESKSVLTYNEDDSSKLPIIQFI